MPSSRHEALVLLLRSPTLLVELLAEVPGLVALPADARATLVSETFRQLGPVEVHADAVVLVEGAGSRLAIVAEAQLRPDADKRRAWPCYLALLHRDLGCPVLLVVLTLDAEIAAWCAEPIEIAPGFVLRPTVLGPSSVPRVVDLDFAARHVELTVLSALAHAGADEPPASTAQIALAALHALAEGGQIDQDLRADYADVLWSALSAAARRALEGLMSTATREYQSEFAREYFAKGRAEGEARALTAILRARGLEVDAARVEQIRACTDLDRLDAWIRRAANATRVEDVFDA